MGSYYFFQTPFHYQKIITCNVSKIEKPKRIHVLLLWPHLYYIDFVKDDSTTSSTPEQEKRQTLLRDYFYEKIRVILMLNVFYVKIV
jgi:hypothetical protein